MAKLTLSDLASLQNETTAVATLAANNALLETALENTLSRDGTSPNAMGANLDMNSNRILNLPEPATVTEPVRLGDIVADALSVTIDFAAVNGTSATSTLIGTGSKTFVTQSGLTFAVGQFAIAYSTANNANYMTGQITAYSGTSLTINVTAVGGSGTFADWQIRFSGTPGAAGAQGDAGEVSSTGSATANAVARFTDSSADEIKTSLLIVSDTGDLTSYDATNSGDPEIRLGASDAEEVHIQTVYDSAAQTLDYVKFTTDVASATADKGLYRFNVDGTDVLDIDDGGINLKASKGISVAGTDILTDAAGTATLSNIDALDTTTKATIHDSLFNATALAAPAVDDEMPIADTSAASATKTITLADLMTVVGSLPNVTAFNSGDKILVIEGGVAKKADFDDMPGSTSGIPDLVSDGSPQLGGDLETNTFDIIIQNGDKIRSGTAAGHTYALTARDVNGGTDTTFITFTANDTPTCDLAAAVTHGGSAIISQSVLDARATVSVHKNGTDQTGVTQAAYTKVTFSTEAWDVGSTYASSTWTPPAGKYRITCCLYFTTANAVDNEILGTSLYKNGVEHKATWDARGGTVAKAVNLNCLVEANGTDTFEIYAWGGSTAAKTIIGNAAYTYFQGERIL